MVKFLSTVLLSALSIAAALPEGMSFTPYGLAQYRFRYEFLNSEVSKVSTTSGTYFNTVGYKVGLKATLNKQVSAQFEIGNDWGATELTNDSMYNYSGVRKALSPYFSLAYAKWDPGYLHIEAGIIPVKGTSVTDILGVSLRYGNYQKSSHYPWVAISNMSMQGFRIGAPITKGEFKLGVDLMTSIVKQRPIAAAKEFHVNKDAILIMAEFPMSIKGLTLTPQFITIPYKNYNALVNEASTEFMGGIEGTYKLNDGVSFRFGYGIAVLAQNDPTSKDTIVKNDVGMNYGAAANVKAGPGKIDLELRMASLDNTKIEDETTFYPFVDAKYIWGVNKYFTITPRVRLFITNAANNDYTVITRPELMFTSAF
jgi:hypothetical protein